MNSPRILFAGSPDIAVPLLKAVLQKFEVVAVLCATDKPQGRSKEPVACPVKVAAIQAGIKVLQFDSLKTEARQAVKETGADTLLTFAYGKIFGPKFLSLFTNGAFNVHPSALPLLRGASPIQHTILNGFKDCVISFQNIGLEMDAGDIWARIPVEIDGTETTETLTFSIAEKAAQTIPGILEEMVAGKLSCRAQKGEPTFCSVIERKDAFLDFNRRKEVIHSKIRAMYPWPKACCKVNGKDIFITGVWGGFKDLEDDIPRPDLPNGYVYQVRKDRGIGVVCSNGIIWISSLQLPGKKELDFKSFINGNRWITEAVFS